MNCTRIRELLDDHIDNALPAEQRRAVDAHLRDCPACEEERRRLRRLVADLAALPTSVEPPRDLWGDINARLDRPARPVERDSRFVRWQPMLAAAALLLVAVGIGVAIKMIDDDPGSLLTPVPRAELASASAGEPKTFADAESDLENAKQSLRARLDTQRDALSPHTVRVIDENLEVIDGAIAEIQGALAKDPNNPELQRMLVAQHNRQLGLLKQVTQFASKRQRSEP